MDGGGCVVKSLICACAQLLRKRKKAYQLLRPPLSPHHVSILCQQLALLFSHHFTSSRQSKATVRHLTCHLAVSPVQGFSKLQRYVGQYYIIKLCAGFYRLILFQHQQVCSSSDKISRGFLSPVQFESFRKVRNQYSPTDPDIY